VPVCRLVVGVVAAPLLLLLTVSVGGGWVGGRAGRLVVIGLTAAFGAAVLATCVPLAGLALVRRRGAADQACPAT